MRPTTRSLAAFAVFLLIWPTLAHAQFGNQGQGQGQFGQQNGNNANVFGNPNQGLNAGATSTGQGSSGGAANADFDSLIDLIESTVATETWASTGGGEAEMRPFPTGVMVDTAGTLKLINATAPDANLAALHRAGRRSDTTGATAGLPSSVSAGAALADKPTSDPRQPAKLRYVSLPRLEQEIIRRQAAHEPFDPAMLTLAGLHRVQFIFVYPKSEDGTPGDIVLAGPAGDWNIDPFGRILSTESGQPIVRLDDLLTLLRRIQQTKSTYFGCAINPRPAALAATQAYLDQTAAKPLAPGRRDAWLEKIRSTMGRQDVEIFGLDPTTRVARVLVEADVHMKLVGMGLEDGVTGVESYLDSAKNAARAGVSPSSMAVLRWWFALNYQGMKTAPNGNAYELIGDGVCVLSENEMLAAQGQRIHTGQSDPLNQQFAESFTAHFAALADKYPVYGELRTIFDLALTLAIIDADGLTARAGWEPSRLLDNEKLRLPHGQAPREVDTVANVVSSPARGGRERNLIAGVSGGVMVDTKATLANRVESTDANLPDLRAALPKFRKAEDQSITWWWDAPTSAR